MATKGFSNRQKSISGRKLILILAMVVLVAVIVWRQGFYKPQLEINEGAISRAVVQEPEIALPVSINPIGEKPAAAGNLPAETATQISQAKTEVPPVIVRKPGYELYEKGVKELEAKNYIAARKNLTQAVELGLDEAEEKDAFTRVNQAADEWLFSPRLLEGDSYCRSYQVVAGDRLAAIGNQFSVPYEFIMKINKISNPAGLSVGKNLKVVQGPFHLKVNRKKYYMLVYLGDVLARVYPVGLGAPDRITPTGLWVAQAGKKQVNPAWPDQETGKYYKPDDPENPLGERWIGLEGFDGDAQGRSGFGIHGTIKPEEIGKSASRGCIRLRNEDVEELFDMVTDGQSKVWVYDE